MSEIAYPKAKTQFEMLRELTRTTGVIHEAQALQLKMWPMVLFADSILASSQVDMDKKVVTFTVTFVEAAEKMPLELFRERVGYLGAWVQELLGLEWSISVETEGPVPMRMSVGRKIVNVPAHPLSRAEGS